MTILPDGRDRLSEWRHALLRYVKSGYPDLTNRQMALLLVVGREGGLYTVRGLAARLGVSKPVVTRALNSLTGLELVKRRIDERDRRSVFIDLTAEGEIFLVAFEALLGDDSEDQDGSDIPRPRQRTTAAA